MLRRTALVTTALLTLLAAPLAAQERIKLTWWHSMDGGLGEALKAIVAEFNASQDAYELTETWKGNYRTLLNAVIAAYRAGEQPHVFQNNETGVITLLLSGAIEPAHDLLDRHGVSIDLDDYLPPVIDTYTVGEGRVLGMPFNSSTPILYFNRDLLRRAGFEQGPTTWQEMETMIVAAQEKGVLGAHGRKVCGFAFSGGLWDSFENWSAIHDQPYATKRNGRDGLDAELIYNKTKVVTHMDRMARWLKAGLAEFGADNPTDWGSGAMTNFLAGNCLFWTASTASHARVERSAAFDWFATYLPYDPDVIAQPINSTIGGAALYVLKGHKPTEYAGIARFFDFLTSVEVQKDWHKATGYVPITIAAYESLVKDGYYQQHPTYELAVKQLLRTKPTDNSRVPRIGNFENVRLELEAELRKVWAGELDPQTALDNGVRRGNEILRRFEQQNRGKL